MTTEQRNALLAELRAGFEMGSHRAPSWADVAFLLSELDAARADAEKFRNGLESSQEQVTILLAARDHLVEQGDQLRCVSHTRTQELDAARARERHALVAGADALRRIAAATPIGHEDVTKGPSTYTWLCYAASLLMAEAATTPATPLEQELITMRAREAKIREALRETPCHLDCADFPREKWCLRCAALAEGEDWFTSYTPCHWTKGEIEYTTDCGQVAFPVSKTPDGKCNGCGRQIVVSVLPSQP